jgi:hypothetical protein
LGSINKHIPMDELHATHQISLTKENVEKEKIYDIKRIERISVVLFISFAVLSLLAYIIVHILYSCNE